MTETTEKMKLYHGASWMDLNGEIYIVPGFHEEWLHEHVELSGGNRTVADLILEKRWISIVLFAKGYLEICINDRNDRDVAGLLHDFLMANEPMWESVLIMPMLEESFIQISKSDLGDREAFIAHLACFESGPELS